MRTGLATVGERQELVSSELLLGKENTPCGLLRRPQPCVPSQVNTRGVMPVGHAEPGEARVVLDPPRAEPFPFEAGFEGG